MPQSNTEKEYAGEAPFRSRIPPRRPHRSEQTYAARCHGKPGCVCSCSDKSNPAWCEHAAAKLKAPVRRCPRDIVREVDRSNSPHPLDTLAVPYSRSPYHCAIVVKSGPDESHELAGYKTPPERDCRQSSGCPDRTACDTHWQKHHRQ